MKQILTLFGLLCYIVLNAQEIEPFFKLEECGAAVLIDEEPIMAVVENINEVPNLAFYNLEKKELMQRFKCQLPENPIAHMIPCDDGIIYLITKKKNKEQGPPLFDAIYGFDYKKDRIKLYYQETEEAYIPRSANAVHIKLVLYRGTFSQQPLIYNTATLAFEPFSADENLRMLFANDAKRAFVVFRDNEIRADDTVPIYVMNLNGGISECVGSYDSNMTLSTNKDENRLPGLTITNPEYNWLVDAYNQSGLPLSGFAMATRPGLAKKFNQFSNMYDISELTNATSNYIIAKSKLMLFVYDVSK